MDDLFDDPDVWGGLNTVASDVDRARWRTDRAAWVEERLGESLWSAQRRALKLLDEHRKTAWASCHGIGKALDLDTPLPTPTGWTTMRDVRVGDELLDEAGQPTRVTAVSSVETRACYAVRFGRHADDVVVAADTHGWAVVDARRHAGVCDWRDHWDDARVVTTLELGGAARVPVTRPLRTAVPWSIALSPYAFGLWLGDGSAHDTYIRIDHEDAVVFADMLGRPITKVWHRDGRRPYARIPLVDHPYRDAPGKRWGARRGARGAKQIPVACLRAAYEDRLALLRGIMDTDGCVAGDDTRRVVIGQVNARLADDIAELARSLGWKVNRFENGVMSMLNFTPDVNPFKLPRKADRWAAAVARTAGRAIETRRTIRGVTPVGEREVRCVEVDSPRRLYLAGRAMVPTHNSWLAARAVAHWLDVHDPGDAFVVTTAPSQAQVRGVLWVREIARAKAAGNLAGRLNQTEWWLPVTGPDGKTREELVAFGRKTADHDHTSFQGIHAPYVLVVGDESCGLDASLLDAMLTLASNDASKILLVGNPDDPDCAFAEAMRPGSGYATLHISAFETPAFTGEVVPARVARSLVGRNYVEDFRRKWAPTWRWVDAEGRDADVETGVRVVPPAGADEFDTHPWWQSKVLGRFPKIDTTGSLIPVAWVKQAQARDLVPNDKDIDLGLDVGASVDGDPTCCAVRRGSVVRVRYEKREPDTMKSAGRAFMELRATRGFDAAAPRRRGGPRLKVDYIGVGRGIVDRGKEEGLPVYPVTVSRRAYDQRAYADRLSEEWWTMRGRFERGEIDLDALDDQTAGELLMLRWAPDSSGRVKVTYAAGPSPNRADAVMLAFAEPDRERVDLGIVGGHMGLPSEKKSAEQLAAELGIDLEAEARALEAEDAP